MTFKTVNALYGTLVGGSLPVNQSSPSKLQIGGLPYVGRQRCIANEDTCEGPKAKGTEYCIGHLRANTKKETE